MRTMTAAEVDEFDRREQARWDARTKEWFIAGQIKRLGIHKPVAEPRGVYVGYAKPGEIERVEQLLIERRARMFKS